MKSTFVCIAAAALLAACSTTKLPERFHTLLPAERTATAPAAGGAPLYVGVQAVGIPPQVDHAQWVVRQADESLLLLEQDRWAAPLQDELRGAIIERLVSRWGALDVRFVAMLVPTTWTVRVDVQRFESIPGREARLEAVWSVTQALKDRAALVCRTHRVEAVSGAGVPALAEAHRRAVSTLADEIGQRLRALHAGQPAAC
jgi:uncharacterized lipoprotein YmbA